MEQIAWSDAYSLGLPELDDEHQQLFQTVADIQRAHARGAEPETFRALSDFLVAYARQHFDHETRLMEAHGFPAQGAHEAAHQGLVRQLSLLLLQADLRPTLGASELVPFLQRWLKQHILEEDMAFKRFLEQQRQTP